MFIILVLKLIIIDAPDMYLQIKGSFILIYSNCWALSHISLYVLTLCRNAQ